MKAGAVCAVVLLSAALAVAGPTVSVDADAFAPGTILNDAFGGITLTDVQGVPDVWSAESSAATTGTHVFGDASDDHDWDAGEFRVDFVSGPAVWVSIDAIADGSEDYGRLEAYAADGTLLAGYTTTRLDNSGVDGALFETMLVAPGTPIAYILAGAGSLVIDDDVELDNLIYEPYVIIPVPRGVLLGSIGVCLLCWLRKWRTFWARRIPVADDTKKIRA